MTRAASGVVWVGPGYDRGGYGAVTRNYVRGLARAGYPVRLLPTGPRNPEVGAEVMQELRSLERAPVGSAPAIVIHATPELFRIAPRLGFVRRIGCTIFETDGLPPRWVDMCNAMDEVWVPSHFNLETFAAAGVDPHRLAVIPYGIDVAAYSPSSDRRAESPFTFLYVCEFNWRKGLDLLLESFINEFEPGEARLVMRVFSNGHQGVAAGEVERVLYESVQGRLERPPDQRPEVKVITHAQSPAELKRLYETASLYISTDRANGWGVPCQEAMALGIPAATINWSGSTEFMREGNSLLIQPEDELVPVDPRLVHAVPALYSGQRWPRVETAEVRRVMRWAVEHPEGLRAIAEAGARHVRQVLDLDVVARRVVERLSVTSPSRVQRASSAARLYQPWITTMWTGRRILRALGRK
ncbi:MAG: glycosyltransferase family 4 protein [Actinomycetota bacterium]|nr:glycosyltransferase family 4 protein [Actinomycetota bacterium]